MQKAGLTNLSADVLFGAGHKRGEKSGKATIHSTGAVKMKRSWISGKPFKSICLESLLHRWYKNGENEEQKVSGRGSINETQPTCICTSCLG